jgi:hypothetical protein
MGLADACGAPDGRWHLSAGFSLLDTDLLFDGTTQAHLVEQTLNAGVSYRLGPRTSLALGLGVLLDGTVTAPDAAHSLHGGWSGSATLSHVFYAGEGRWPMLLGSATFAESWARAHAPGGTEDPAFAGIDFRVAATAAKTFRNRFTPYLGVSLFGGPIFWRYGGEDVTGTDAYHFQILAGLQVALPAGFDLGLEVAPLGERAVNLSVGFRP